MTFRTALMGLVIAIAMPACAEAAPQALTTDEAPRFCSVLLAEAAAYTDAHALARAERVKVMRFVSEEALNAYLEETEELHGIAAELRADFATLNARFDLPDATEAFDIDETSDGGAQARIEFARECAAALIE
jgi:nitrous oxide reductase accessory protein NosL